MNAKRFCFSNGIYLSLWLVDVVDGEDVYDGKLLKVKPFQLMTATVMPTKSPI